jgi:hypothetical protein
MTNVASTGRQKSGDRLAVVRAARLQLPDRRSMSFCLLLGVVPRVLRAPGVAGAWLEAGLLMVCIWALSSWTSRRSMAVYSKGDPRGSTPSRFVRKADSRSLVWEMAGKPEWVDAIRQIRVGDLVGAQ